MRVKKFEAKNMKDALAMVKAELGPDAVILSAKENRNRNGLGAESSVEVTAAVSEQTLQKKKFVESKFRGDDKDRFLQSSARQQKAIIDKMVGRRLQQVEDEAPRPPRTTMSYIDIKDEGSHQRADSHGTNAAEVNALNERAMKRIRGAAKEALRAGMLTLEGNQSTKNSRTVATKPTPNSTKIERVMGAGPTTPTPVPRVAASAPVAAVPLVQTGGVGSDPDVLALREEIKRLHGMIESFSKAPANFTTPHPGADFGISYDLSATFQKLTQAGIGIENAVDLLKTCQTEMDVMQIKRPPLVDAWIARRLLDLIQVSPQPMQARMHLFVGGSGSGKTSSLIKLASKLVIEEKKRVAVVSTDTFKVGAVDQMKIYCQILNVPFAIVRTRPEWEWVLNQLTHVDHILVDFPGFNLRDMDEISLFRSLLPPEQSSMNCHMVVSCTAKDGDALEISRRYKIANTNDLIFTNLDQSSQHGIIYNVQKKLSLPLHSFGIGNRIPEDIEFATKERVLDLLFKLTKIRREKA